MTIFRLDSYHDENLDWSELVDGVESDAVALHLLLDECRAEHCRLYRDNTLLGEMDHGIWRLSKRQDSSLTEALKVSGLLSGSVTGSEIGALANVRKPWFVGSRGEEVKHVTSIDD